jgi:hypothetical protein
LIDERTKETNDMAHDIKHEVLEDVTAEECDLTTAHFDSAPEITPRAIFGYLREIAGQPELAARLERR